MTHAAAPGMLEDDAYAPLRLAANLCYVIVGMYAAAFGPVLPFIASDADVSLDTAGIALTAFFVGSIAASAIVAIRLHVRDPRMLTVVGLFIVAAGAVVIGLASSWALLLASAVLMGVGDGLIVAATHILVAVTARDVPSAINRVNAYFGLGAVVGAAGSGVILSSMDDRWLVYAAIASISVATAVLLARAPMPPRAIAAAAHSEGFRMPGHPVAWVMGVVLFLYVGAEFGLGSWVSTYVQESAGAGVLGAALLTAGYWAALALGRVASGVYFSRGHGAATLLLLALAGAGASSVVLALTTGSLVLSAVAAFAVGLCLGPIWPSTVAIASEGQLADATATTVTMGNSGGVVLPWAQGKVLVGVGPSEGVWVTAALCGVMLAIVAAFHRTVSRAPDAN